MAAPQKQMWGHRPQHSHTQLNNNYTGLHTYWSNELSAWYARSLAHHINNLTYLYQQWIKGSSLTGTTGLPCHYQPRTNTLYGLPNSSLGKPPWGSFWVIVTDLIGHHDLSEMIYPNPAWLPTQNSGIHWVDRLNSWLIGSYMVITTLHTPSISPRGLHMLFLTRKDRYHTCFSCYH